jgi:microcompartment protein CcmL/EutN
MDGPAVESLYFALQRYAGWLDRGRASVAVRTDVQALGAAIDAGADASALLSSLEATIVRLPGGDMRKMLRVTAGQIRRALDEP